MKNKFVMTALLLAPLAAFMPGCASDGHHGHGHSHAEKAHESGWESVRQVAAVITPTAGNSCKGVVKFTEVGGTVYVHAELEGLTPNQQHAMHIHEFGDTSGADGMKTGGHYNPEGHAHGLPSAAARHAGDLGNVQADASGKAIYKVEATNISMVGLKNPIIGRAVIVHAKPDDGGQPVGNAGARIGQGVIGISNVAK